MVTAPQKLSRAHLRWDPERGALSEVLAVHLETFLAHGASRNMRSWPGPKPVTSRDSQEEEDS